MIAKGYALAESDRSGPLARPSGRAELERLNARIEAAASASSS
jgi:hypothetical protein